MYEALSWCQIWQVQTERSYGEIGGPVQVFAFIGRVAWIGRSVGGASRG